MEGRAMDIVRAESGDIFSPINAVGIIGKVSGVLEKKPGGSNSP
jgi:hypothetical protein